MSILLGFVGMATDVGILLYEKRVLQTAADAAAVGGATEVPYIPQNASAVTTAATKDATMNGITAGTVSTPNGSVVTTLTVNNPPLYGPHSGASNTNYVEAIVTQTEPVFFMRLFGKSSVMVTARAVAEVQNNPGCMYALDPASADSFFLNGTFLIFVDAPSCAIYVNSNSSTALAASGFLDEITAKFVGIVGNYNSGFFNFINPHPVTGIAPVSDPLAYLNPPATAGCLPSHTNMVVSTGTILTPGNYCGTYTGGTAHAAITINSAAAVTFASGTYIINGGGATNATAPAAGGLNLTGSALVSTAAGGATFYLYNGATVNINGFGITLQAPPGSSTTAAFPGILFYQDRSDNSPATIGGTLTTLDLEGALYMPASTLNFQNLGTVTFSNYGIYVANKIQFNGALGLFIDYAKAASSGSVSPIKGVSLVE
jgi:hypothetical protein